MPKLTRRALVPLAAATLGAVALPPGARAALSTAQAKSFVQQLGQKFVSIVNGPGSLSQKQQQMQPIVDHAVDVNGVGRFVLGRFWRTATQQQQQQYLQLFHKVLMRNITGRLGDYTGVQFTLNGAVQRADGVHVQTTITRPNHPPAQVAWVVDDVDGQPRIVDVIAEGTSLRLTQRSDYTSYLVNHGDSITALIDALRRQVGHA